VVADRSETPTNLDPILVDFALQGGGAHGAFTWGVLDRLLEEERLVFERQWCTYPGPKASSEALDTWMKEWAVPVRSLKAQSVPAMPATPAAAVPNSALALKNDIQTGVEPISAAEDFRVALKSLSDDDRTTELMRLAVAAGEAGGEYLLRAGNRWSDGRFLRDP